MSSFADHHLGKGVVIAKDTPNFIGNHLALAGVVRLLWQVAAGEYTIEEIDAMTGPRDRPSEERDVSDARSGRHRHPRATSSDNLHERLPMTRRAPDFVLPPFVEQMLAKGLIGEKSGQGFYKRVKGRDGESEILTLDHETLEYRPRKPPKLAVPRRGKRDQPTRPSGSHAVQRQGPGWPVFLRSTLAPALVYTASVDTRDRTLADDVDRVMRWGFGWELGPFEIADAIGIDRVVEVGSRGRSRAAGQRRAGTLAARRSTAVERVFARATCRRPTQTC